MPLGAFLSGGLDSAAVLALMAKHSAAPVQAFSIGFGDPEYDELEEASVTARAFGAEHHVWQVTPDCVTIAEQLATYYDEPFADPSAVPTFVVAELARKHVTVCLTGDGGDELFAGYVPYAQALRRSTAPATRGLRALAGLGARWLPAPASWRWRWVGTGWRGCGRSGRWRPGRGGRRRPSSACTWRSWPGICLPR